MEVYPGWWAAVSEYPGRWEADVVLADGGTAHVRPIVAEDGDRWSRFISQLSPRTVYFRFFTEHPQLGPAEREHFTNVDHVGRVAFLALLGDEIVGVGRYDRIPGSLVAEVAFVVADEHHGRGLASILLEHLAAAARERGLRRFEAEVLTGNPTMVRVFQDAGFRIEREFERGSTTLAFDIEPTEQSVEVMRAREHWAESRSIARLLHPGAVAVVGASRSPDSLGHTVLRHILDGDFPGPVYPVNPAATAVASVGAYPSVLDIPEAVDLAVVIAPVAALAEVVAQCGDKGVCGLVVVTDLGDPEVDRAVVLQARGYGMRVVGPGSLGLICPGLGLNSSLAPILPGRRGLGVSTFVSGGNGVDVSSDALLQFWEEDEGTDVVLLYLEAVGKPRKFARLARRVSWRKPVVVLMAAAATDVEAAVLRQAGVVLVQNGTELCDVAILLVSQPLPAGRRLAVVSDSPALARLAVSAAGSLGLPRPDPRILAYGTPAQAYRQAVDDAAREAGAGRRPVLPLTGQRRARVYPRRGVRRVPGPTPRPVPDGSAG